MDGPPILAVVLRDPPDCLDNVCRIGRGPDSAQMAKAVQDMMLLGSYHNDCNSCVSRVSLCKSMYTIIVNPNPSTTYRVSVVYHHIGYRKLFCAYIPVDYDELVEDDAGKEDSDVGAEERGNMIEEDANAILNEEDMDTDSSTPFSTHRTRTTDQRPTDHRTTELSSQATRKDRVESTGSGFSTTRTSSTKLSSLYFSTQMARSSAIPSRVLGGGSDPRSDPRAID
jgi:hypothetical protein